MNRRTVIAAVLASCMLLPANIFSCGPFFEQPVFVTKSAPESPEHYVDGQLGIVQPTYETAYLVIAYRYLNGVPLTASERKQFLGPCGGPCVAPATEVIPNNENTAVREWQQARALVPNLPPDQNNSQQYDGWGWASFVNCTDGAYQNAAHTLRDRIRQFGADNVWIKDWVLAEDSVFANCNAHEPRVSGEKVQAAPVVPPTAPPGAPELIRKDREYQIAAAELYAENFDEAELAFEKIAQDKASPWHELARYVVARVLIRKSTLDAPPDASFDAKTMLAAEAQLKSIIADPAVPNWHRSARELLGFVEARLHPADYNRELAERLAHSDESFKHDVTDYHITMRSVAMTTNSQPQAALAASETGVSELSDWIANVSGSTNDGAQYALERWHRSHSDAWLVAALAHTHAGQSWSGELAQAVAALEPRSPAYATANFHRVRLLLEQHENTRARHLLDDLLATADVAKMPSSAVNAFKQQRMPLARNVNEFLIDAQRRPAGFRSDADEELTQDPNDDKDPYSRASFPADAAEALNVQLPLTVLSQAARSEILVSRLRRDVLLGTWTRAALLPSGTQTAIDLAGEVEKFEPEITPLMKEYLAAQGGDARRFAAVYLILHFPGLRPTIESGIGREGQMYTTDTKKPLLEVIDNFRNNWWCDLKNAKFGETSYLWSYQDGQRPKRQPVTLPFLTVEQQHQAAHEWKQVEELGEGPNFLATAVIAWARQHPEDNRVPEGLHLAVRTTRYGCVNKETSRLSHEAFDLLHTRYGKTEWARRTPYWF
jgi:hypothetical protein